MSERSEEVRSRKTLTAHVKENPLASVAITAISSALITFMGQNYATVSYVSHQRQEMESYFNDKTKILEEKQNDNKETISKLEEKLDKIDDKLDLIKDRIYTIKR